MERITQSNVDGAFKRLHRAMEWPDKPPYSNDSDGQFKCANPGSVYLASTPYGYQVEVISNEGGGVHTPFPGWSSKREAFNTMASMAAAVEQFKRGDYR